MREWPASRAAESGHLASDIVQMALTEATRIRLEALRSGERMYQELLKAARARAEEIAVEGRREADRIVAEARMEAAAIRARRIHQAGPPSDDLDAIRSELSAITRLLAVITGEDDGAPTDTTPSPNGAISPLAALAGNGDIPLNASHAASNGRDVVPERGNGGHVHEQHSGDGEEAPRKERPWAPPDWMSLE